MCIVVRFIVLWIYCSDVAKHIVVPASPLAHSNRREGRVAFRRAFPFRTCIAWERRMWVLRDLSVSAARPQAIFLIRSFRKSPPLLCNRRELHIPYRALSACWLLRLMAGHANLCQACLPTCRFIYIDSAIRDEAKGNLRNLVKISLAGILQYFWEIPRKK